MAEERFDERTEPATARRREEAREHGHVARSADLNAALVLLAALLALHIFGGEAAAALLDALRVFLGEMPQMDLDESSAFNLLVRAALFAARAAMPVLVLVLACAVLANVLQVGFLLAAEPLEPKLERMDPIEGLRRIFSVRSMARLGFSLVKVVAVSTVLYLTLRGEWPALLSLMDREVDGIADYLARTLFIVGLRAGLVLLALAVLDYAYQRWQYERDLRMSRQEIREEMKRMEGDPQVRERRRRVHRQLVIQSMLKRVPRATVVITNPTHYAVALEYRADEMPAPRCVAKGADDLALRIRQIAKGHGVPVVEKPAVARALYASVEVDQSIPEDLYKAVAEILAYVYKTRGAAA